MIPRKNNCCRVGLALYNFDWIYGSGTQRIAEELVRNLLKLKQSVVEYKVLLRHDVVPEQIGLLPETCMKAPAPSYLLRAKIRRRIHRLWYKGVDMIRGWFGQRPMLGYIGKLWVKDWLRSLDFDLLFYPTAWQHELIQEIPIAAQLYDMQHIYYPEFWQHDTFQRQVVLGWYRDNACLITCNFDFVAEDIKSHLRAPEERIATIFLAPPNVPSIDIAYERSVREKFKLPERYFIYPAATWPHKNHINLVRAIAQCVSEGLDIFCICPGEYADWLYPGQFLKIQEEIRKYGLEKNIYFPGCLSAPEVYALMQGADFVCVPTLYEAGCYPVWEAVKLGKAIACSDVTMIPYQIRDAGLLFNPNDPGDIAKAIQLLCKDKELKNYLGNRAKTLAESSFYSSEKTALGYHRAFIHSLIRLGKLAKELWIEADPAPPLDRGPRPPRFEWRSLL